MDTLDDIHRHEMISKSLTSTIFVVFTVFALVILGPSHYSHVHPPMIYGSNRTASKCFSGKVYVMCLTKPASQYFGALEHRTSNYKTFKTLTKFHAEKLGSLDAFLCRISHVSWGSMGISA